ncbi:MAG: response regulator [Elusimicrobia bacterium]|nr:response regulator [Elusimicrobiota bacterium]
MAERKRILIVDDDPSVLESLAAYLTQQGYEVMTADNGKEALQRVLAERLDLILLDLMLPFNDGYSIARQLTGKFGAQAPKILILTSRDMAREREAALASGACDVLMKPAAMADLTELRDRLRALLADP